MGTIFIDTTGSPTNSGSSDNISPDLAGIAATVAASVITLDGSPNLSGLITSGDSQSSILLQQATNANRKVFWITAFDNNLKTVTVDVAPTGVVSSAWAIGGKHLLTNASIEGALRAGDTAIFNNSPAPAAGTRWTFRNAGTSAAGYAKIKGKIGVRPVITTTDTSNCINMNNLAVCWIENLEIVQQGATGAGIASVGANALVFNVKVSDSGSGHSIATSGGGFKILCCEISGSAGDGINGANQGYVLNCYIHDNAGNGIAATQVQPNQNIIFCTIAENGGRGILLSGASTIIATTGCMVFCCTIYGNGDSGLEISDADTVCFTMGCIFQNNGNAPGEANVEWAAGFAEAASLHGWNDLFNGSGADAPINFTLNAQVPGSEISTSPALLDPAQGKFQPEPGSPVINAGAPIGLATSP